MFDLLRLVEIVLCDELIVWIVVCVVVECVVCFLLLSGLCDECMLCSSSGRLIIVMISELRIMVDVMKIVVLWLGSGVLLDSVIGIDSMLVSVIVLCMLLIVIIVIVCMLVIVLVRFWCVVWWFVN